MLSCRFRSFVLSRLVLAAFEWQANLPYVCHLQIGQHGLPAPENHSSSSHQAMGFGFTWFWNRGFLSNLDFTPVTGRGSIPIYDVYTVMYCIYIRWMMHVNVAFENTNWPSFTCLTNSCILQAQKKIKRTLKNLLEPRTTVSHRGAESQLS